MADEDKGVQAEVDEEALFQQFASELAGNGADTGTDTDTQATGDLADATDAPAGSPATEEGGTPPEGAGAAGSVEDVWANATPAQRQAWEDAVSERARLAHAESSNRNRVAALQRKLDEQEAKLRQLSEQSQSTSPAGAGEGAPAGAPADLTKFAEDFPEVFAAVRTLQAQETAQLHQTIAQLQAQLAQVAQPVHEMEQNRVAQVKQTQLQALAARHPDYIQIQNKPEFWAWLDTQSPGIRNLVGSDSAEDNSILLDVYKKATQQTAVIPPSANPETPPHRPREAEGRESLPRTGVSRMEGVPTDENALWDYWSRQAEQKRI